jgi:hypothetical protein
VEIDEKITHPKNKRTWAHWEGETKHAMRVNEGS